MISIGSTEKWDDSLRKLKYRRIKRRVLLNFVDMHLWRYSGREIYTFAEALLAFPPPDFGKEELS
jgi:hypothetical protein